MSKCLLRRPASNNALASVCLQVHQVWEATKRRNGKRSRNRRCYLRTQSFTRRMLSSGGLGQEPFPSLTFCPSTTQTVYQGERYPSLKVDIRTGFEKVESCTLPALAVP